MHDETTSALAGAPPTGDDDARDTRLRRGTTIGRYIVIERLGTGGMGDVYAAWDEDLRRRVALKLVRPRPGESTQRPVLQEARALARLQHPHVVAVHDVGADDDLVFVSMALLEGQNAKQWLAENKPSADERTQVLLQCARGLAAAHQAGLVHHDVKPSNVMIETREGGPWASLIDFGIAADADDETQRGGTRAYMAPEVRAGGGGSARADQYSLALLGVELLSGTRPISEDLAEGRLGPVGPAKDALARALRADPAERHPDVDALLRALERSRRPPNRRASWMAGGLAVALGLGTWAAAPSASNRCAEAATAALADAVPQRDAHLRLLAEASPDVAQSLTTRLSQWDTRWTGARAQACSSGDEEGSQQCLDSEAREVGALLDVAAAQPGARWQVLGALTRNLDADRCATGSGAPPLTDGLARAGALEIAAAFDEAYGVAEAERTAAQTHGDVPRELAAVYRLGSIERRRDNFDAAVALTEQAMQLAGAARDPRTQTHAALERVESWISLGTYDAAREGVAMSRSFVAAAGDPPDLLSYWHYVKGRTFEVTSAFDEAAAAYEVALEIREQTDADSLYVADTLRSLGYVNARRNRCEDGDAQLQAAVAVYVARLGAGSPSEAYCLSARAQCLAQGGDVEQALTLSREAARILETTRGSTSEDLAKILTMQGAILGGQGLLEQAREPFTRALAIRTELLGPEHPETILAATNLGWMLLTLGELDAAEPMLTEALAGATALRGPDHPKNASILGAMAALYGAREQFEDAMSYQRRGLAAAEASPQASNAMTLVTPLVNLGELALKAGRLDEATDAYHRAHAIARDAPNGTRGPLWGAVNLGLGTLALRRGDTTKAESSFEEAVKAQPSLQAQVDALRE
ncbi:MAG: serine/threonine-protein kinase [Myxococcota bacterium]